MVYQKKTEPEKREYRAVVNLSIGRVDRGPDGRNETAERVERGHKTWLTDEEASNLGRFVRLVETEENDKVPTRVSPARILGIREVDKNGANLQGSGALDMKDKTTVYTEAEADEEAQPTKNPSDPSYKGKKD
jgi:hypothetical protein